MKKAIKVAVFTVLFIAVFAGAVYGYLRFGQSDFVYKDGAKSGTLEVSGYTGEEKNIIIPSSHRGKKVAYISNNVFSGSDIESVELPDSIVSIGESAFSECKNLKSVSFGKGLEYIGLFAFKGCASLEKAEFNSPVKDFTASVFLECEKLGEITFPETADFTVADRVVFSKDKTVAVWSPKDVDLAKFAFPDTVKKYGMFFFYGHDEIKNFTFPEGTQTIERGVLAYCKNLTEVTLPEGVKKLDHNAFFSCSSLKSINLPASITSIGDYEFSSKELVVRVKENSYAYNYAKQNEIKYELEGK